MPWGSLIKEYVAPFAAKNDLGKSSKKPKEVCVCGGGLERVYVTKNNHSLKTILSSFRDFYFLGVWGGVMNSSKTIGSVLVFRRDDQFLLVK